MPLESLDMLFISFFLCFNTSAKKMKLFIQKIVQIRSSDKNAYLKIIFLFFNQNIPGPHSAVGNVSDCRTRGHKFDPGPVSILSRKLTMK